MLLGGGERLAAIAAISVSVDRTGLPFEEPVRRGPGRPKKGAPKNPCPGRQAPVLLRVPNVAR